MFIIDTLNKGDENAILHPLDVSQKNRKKARQRKETITPFTKRCRFFSATHFKAIIDTNGSQSDANST